MEKRNLWPEHRIQKLIEKQESKDPNLVNLKIISNNLHYFIGLIATDGNIRSKYYECRVMLSDVDVDLLENIQSKFGGGLSQEVKYKRATLSIRYRPFISYLDSIGIRSKKTFDLDMTEYFSGLTEKEKWHFIRGCIDGDGSFSFFKTEGYYRGTFDLAGASESFMNMLQQFLGEDAHIHKRKDCYMISINGRNIQKVLSKVYNLDEDSLYMERKYKKYKEIVDYHNKDNYNPYNRVDESTKKEVIKSCKEQGLTVASEIYGYHKTTLRDWCNQNKVKWAK